jgi:hypothetical protein
MGGNCGEFQETGGNLSLWEFRSVAKLGLKTKIICDAKRANRLTAECFSFEEMQVDFMENASNFRLNDK